ncbi:hypothetical protein PAMP_003292 [Pampus punctatissimus]
MSALRFDDVLHRIFPSIGNYDTLISEQDTAVLSARVPGSNRGAREQKQEEMVPGQTGSREKVLSPHFSTMGARNIIDTTLQGLIMSTLATERESTVIQHEGEMACWQRGRREEMNCGEETYVEEKGNEERREGENGKRDEIEGGEERRGEKMKQGGVMKEERRK